MASRKKPEKLWDPTYRKKMLAARREQARLGMQAYRARKKEQAAAEDGHPVNKKARVGDANDNVAGKAPTETTTADTTERRRKTATRSDKPSEVDTQATRDARTNADSGNAKKISKDNTMNDNECLDTQNEADGSFAFSNVDKVPEKDKDRASNTLLMNGNKGDSQLEGRTLRRKNKAEEKNTGTTDSLSLEPELTENTTKKVLVKGADGNMINVADTAPTPIDIAVSTESEDKTCTENLSTAQDDKHDEVEPQATRSLSATSCLVNQPLIVIVSHPISNNSLSQKVSNDNRSLSVFGSATATSQTTSVPGGAVIIHEDVSNIATTGIYYGEPVGVTRTSASQDQTATTQSGTYTTQEGSFYTDGE